MKYAPIIKKIDDLIGDSTFAYSGLFLALNWILPRSWHLRRELKLWNKTANHHQCILDAGSGLGQNSAMVTSINKNWSVKGLDINSNLIAHCNRVFRKLNKVNAHFQTADLQTNFGTASYDLAMAIDIAEFVENDEVMFENIQQALRPNGAMFLYTHLIDPDNPNKKKTRFKLVEEQRRFGYTRQSLKEKLKNAGFGRVKIRTVFGFAGNLSWKLAILIPLRLLNLSMLLGLILPFYFLLLFPLLLLLNYIETHTGHLTGTALFVKAQKSS